MVSLSVRVPPSLYINSKLPKRISSVSLTHQMKGQLDRSRLLIG